ncbi:hypothetical protein B566_EDAN017346, partial [Ephemera danica]
MFASSSGAQNAMEEAKDCDCVPEAKDCDDDPMEVDADPQDLDEKYSTVSETSCNTHTSSSSSNYATKLNYLFRDCRFFLMKSCNSENISLAKAKGVWSTLVNKEILLDHAVRNCRNTRDSLGGIFKLDWVNRMDLSFDKCGHLYNSLNDSKLVKVGRNGQ